MDIDTMVVTPDLYLRKVLRETVEGLPIRITAEVGSAREAFEQYRKDPVDILIADLFLGEVSGLDALKTLKKTAEGLHFVLLTRIRERSLIDRAFRYGASDVLVYPCAKGAIRETLKHRLKELGALPASTFKA